MYKLYNILIESVKLKIDDVVNYINQFDSWKDFRQSEKFDTYRVHIINNYKNDPKYNWKTLTQPLKDKDEEEERKAKEKAKPNKDAESIKKVAQNYPQYDFSKATIYSKRVGETQKLRNFLDGLYCPKIDFITKEVHGFTNGNYLDSLLKKEVIGCKKCQEDKNGNKIDIEKELEKFPKEHPDLNYDFSQATWWYKGEGKNKKLRVKNIICRNLKNHDKPLLFYQNEDGVAWGQLKQDIGGCPACLANRKSKGERKVYSELEKLGYNFTPEKTFPGAKGCFSYKGQKNCNLLRFDAYIVKDGEEICVEFDGKQHYEPVEYFGGEEGFIITQANDRAKNEYCKNNGIRLIRIPYWDYNKIGKILENEIGYNNKTKQPIAEAQRLQKLAGITEIKIRPKGMGSKYIMIQRDSDQGDFVYFDDDEIEKYLKSVIDPEYIDEVDYFMNDEDIGWDISSFSYLSKYDDDDGNFEISNFLKVTDREIEDYAEQEMSYYLFSTPDEFPYKD